MNFASDNVYGVDAAIMDAVVAANAGAAAAYGGDALTAKAVAALKDVFACDLCAYLVVTGTAANALALSAMCPPYGAVFCHNEAHVRVDECGAPELFTGGAKLIGLDGEGGKISAEGVGEALTQFIREEHDPKPAAVSITQASELGCVYSGDEIAALAEVAHGRGMKLHMDGARFANAVAALECAPGDISWRAGVDALSFGATKNGALACEAVIFFDRSLAEDFRYRRMRAGQLVSKGRFLAAQMIAYLEDDRWLANARHANAMAGVLADGLAAIPGMDLAVARQANEVFVTMARETHDRLVAAGVEYHLWPGELSLAAGEEGDKVVARLVTSFASEREMIDRFLALAGAV